MNKPGAILALAIVALCFSKGAGQEKLAGPPTTLPGPAAEKLSEGPSPEFVGAMQSWGPRPGSSGCCCSLSRCAALKGRLWDWLTYHPLSCPGHCDCCPKCPPCCPPHLYLFFLADCKEAAPLGGCAPTIFVGPEPAPTNLPPPGAGLTPQAPGPGSLPLPTR